MALNNDDIAYLRDQRRWYLAQIEAVNDGTYGVARMERGKRVDDDSETLDRFRRIVTEIEAILTIARADFDA